MHIYIYMCRIHICIYIYINIYLNRYSRCSLYFLTMSEWLHCFTPPRPCPFASPRRLRPTFRLSGWCPFGPFLVRSRLSLWWVFLPASASSFLSAALPTPCGFSAWAPLGFQSPLLACICRVQGQEFRVDLAIYVANDVLSAWEGGCIE